MHSRLQRLFYTGSMALVLFVLPPAVAQQAGQGGDESAIVTWSADLEGKNETPAVETQATARAEFEFDFRKQEATVKILGQNLRDVTKVSLGAEHHLGNLKAAAAVAKLALYEALKDGPFPQPNANAVPQGGLPLVFSKKFSGSAFHQIADAVLNGQGVVEIHTKAHPQGELIGLVQMHKSYR